MFWFMEQSCFDCRSRRRGNSNFKRKYFSKAEKRSFLIISYKFNTRYFFSTHISVKDAYAEKKEAGNVNDRASRRHRGSSASVKSMKRAGRERREPTVCRFFCFFLYLRIREKGDEERWRGRREQKKRTRRRRERKKSKTKTIRGRGSRRLTSRQVGRDRMVVNLWGKSEHVATSQRGVHIPTVLQD